MVLYDILIYILRYVLRYCDRHGCVYVPGLATIRNSLILSLRILWGRTKYIYHVTLFELAALHVTGPYISPSNGVDRTTL